MSTETKTPTFKILKTIASNNEQIALEKASKKLDLPTKLLEVTTKGKCFVVTKR